MKVDNIRATFSFDNVECCRVFQLSEEKLADETNRNLDFDIGEGYVEYTAQGDYRFINRKTSFRFEFIDGEYNREISDFFLRNYSNAASVHPGKNNKFTLFIRFFPAKVRIGRLELLVPEKIREELATRDILQGTRFFSHELKKHFVFDGGLDNCFIFSKGREINTDLTETDGLVDEDDAVLEEDSDTTLKENKESEKENKNFELDGSFRIYGDSFDLLCGIEKIGQESHVQVYRVLFKRKRPEGLQELGIGELSFSDSQSYIRAAVQKKLEETPQYLTSWDSYAKMEGEFLLAKAKKIGVIACEGEYFVHDDCMDFTILNFSEETAKKFDVIKAGEKDGEMLELVDNIPEYISEDLDWDDYKKRESDEKNVSDEIAKLSGGQIKSREQRQSVFKVIRKPSYPQNPTLTLKVQNGILPEGKCDKYLFAYSMRGDETQIKRREDARRRIIEGTAEMPNLGLILGADSEAADFDVSDKSARSHIEPLSLLVRSKVFTNPPTDHQMKAIDIALNTPDVAIIQGPPGTGKTTVITAIIERLNEIIGKQNTEPGQVLITSLQHDAVNNIIERLDINSLPTIKFGKKKDEPQTSMEMSIMQWCDNVINKLKEKHDFLAETKNEQDLLHLFIQYNLLPDDSQAKNFLEAAKKYAAPSLLMRINNILMELSTYDTSEAIRKDMLLSKIYQLPVTEEGYSDDGWMRVEELLVELEEQFGDDFGKSEEQDLIWQKRIRNQLEKAEEGPYTQKLEMSLKQVRAELLNRFIPREKLEMKEPRADIIEIYHELKQMMHKPQDDYQNAIYQFYNTILAEGPELRRALASYTFAFAATAQQSEGKEIKKAKGVKKNEHASYDTVIVDEAARVAPGDLMIPLSQAKRRIILVGDQKQLPHIYDEEIFESLREKGEIVSGNDIKESMFEHLWNTAKKLEKQDGICRTITLDKQYRTHPLLGNFISQNFYEPDGEGFDSPRPAEDFTQPITPHACVWIDIPHDKGLMQRLSTGSKIREVEAEYISQRIVEYLNRKNCDKLSFGVITFYSGQRELIKRKLKDAGVASDNNPRIRVGTVDEFQGMEFDVIFLSVVRSIANFKQEDLDKLLQATDKEKPEIIDELRMKYYGFLNDHRLCVALSRQKKLLIIVGDSAMFAGLKAKSFASQCVGAMLNLYELCKKEGSVVHG